MISVCTGLQVRVIGGGVIGMSVAWQLARHGAAVTVFDSRRVGNEASWAGAGMLAPGGEFSQHGSLTDLALESLRNYPEFVSELSRESEVSIDFRQSGAFSMAYSEVEADRLQALADRQNGLGIYSEQFAPGRVPGVRPGAVAAQYYPNDGVVNPRDILRALIAVCPRAGITLRECEPVREINEQSEFDVTVLAAGAWSGQVKIVIAGETVAIPEVHPVRGHLIAYDLTASAENSHLSDSIIRHNHTYLLRRSGNALVAGASSEECGFERAIDGRIAEQLAGAAAALMPALAGCGYTAWNGFRPATTDGQPVIGRFSDSSIWLAYGHYRNGILLAPGTAELVTRQISQANLRTGTP